MDEIESDEAQCRMEGCHPDAVSLRLKTAQRLKEVDVGAWDMSHAMRRFLLAVYRAITAWE